MNDEKPQKEEKWMRIVNCLWSLKGEKRREEEENVRIMISWNDERQGRKEVSIRSVVKYEKPLEKLLMRCLDVGQRTMTLKCRHYIVWCVHLHNKIVVEQAHK